MRGADVRWQDCYTSTEVEQLSVQHRTRGFANDDAGWEVLSDLVQRLVRDSAVAPLRTPGQARAIKLDVFNYWDEVQPPGDVRECMASWRASGLHLVSYDRAAADDFLADEFGGDVLAAFRHAHHPAMQADLFRLARIIRLGGLYVDADDAFVGDGSAPMRFPSAATLKPLAVCRHCPASVPVTVPPPGAPDSMHWYYLGNAPIAGVGGHPLFDLALERAVAAVMLRKSRGERANIHADTGPANFSLALLEHVADCFSRDADCDVTVSPAWDGMEQSRWLEYKATGRNWRTNATIYPASVAGAAPQDGRKRG